MGCGGSKSVQVDNNRPPPTTQTQTDRYHTQNASHGSTHVHSGINYGSDGKIQTQQVTQSSHLMHDGSVHLTRYGMDDIDVNEGLPAPKPPTETREQLLDGKDSLLQQADQHAMQVPTGSAATQGLGDFTTNTLLPGDLVTVEQTVRIVDSSTSNTHTNENPSPNGSHGLGQSLAQDSVGSQQSLPTVSADSPRMESSQRRQPAIAPPPLESLGNTYDNADAAEMLLEKYRKDQEIQDHLMKADKMRQNITLQDKLAKRREMKKRALSKGIITASAGAAVVTGAAKEIGEKESDTSDLEMTQDQTIAMDATGEIADAPLDNQEEIEIQPSDEVEASQDKYEAVMAEVAPLPTVPETRKEAIYRDEDNIELFKDLEDFAVNMEQISSPDTTFGLLMDSLLINQLSDLEKVRILFHWITKQDLNTIDFPSNIDDDTPIGCLFAIKSEKKTYAELFSRLCSAAGLHAKVIKGYLKGVGYIPDYKFIGDGDPNRGSWNAVLINGQWRLIDTHWGARHVLVDDDSLDVQQTTVYRYEEHYFLTNPDQMIVTHFPDDSSWQLLEHPITLDQFQENVKFWPLLYKMKLTLLSPKCGVTVTSSDGIAEFRFRTTDFTRRDGKLKCELRTKAKKSKIGDKALEFYTFHYSEGDMEVFRVFCPAVDEYLLKIFGHSNKFSDDEKFTYIAFFQINCPELKTKKMSVNNPMDVKPSELIAPFPEAYRPWGPPRVRGEVAFYPVSHTGPIISCNKDGEATLVMQALGDKCPKFLQDVHVADGRLNDEKESLPDRAVSFIALDSGTRNKLVVFRIRTPAKGIYALNLYSQTIPGGQYNVFNNYLLVSQAQSESSPPFPSVTNGVLGEDKTKCIELNIFPTSSPSCTFGSVSAGNAWLDGENEAYLTFDHSKPLAILAQLESSDGSDLRRNVLIQDTGKKALIVVRPPKRNRNAFEVALKVYAASAAQSSSIPAILSALVTCSQREPELFPPSEFKRWGPNPSSKEVEISIREISSTSPLFRISDSHDDTDPSPCRTFSGGEYIDVKIAFEKRIALSPELSLFDESGQVNKELSEGEVFIYENTENETTLRLSLATSGFYKLTLYGSSDLSVGQFSLLYSILIQANGITTGPLMPRSFSLWSRNICKLRMPLNKYLKRNAVNKIDLCLAQCTESQEPMPFADVLLLTEQSRPVSPNRAEPSTFSYEWEYVPGPGEKLLSVVVQKNPQNSNSLSCVLKFEVVD